MKQLNAILTIAYRDLLKFLRDPARIVGTLVLPMLFVLVMGGSLQANLGKGLGFNLLTYTFTGIFAETLFLSTTTGIISLIEDRENDFSQEIFVSPVSRYAIIFGKIFGESLVAMTQAIGVIVFGFVAGVPLTPLAVLALIPVGIATCLLGGSFGVVLISLFSSQRAANQVIPFLLIPQFFLAGVFNPIRVLPGYLDVLSHLSPLRYAVDLARNLFYAGQPDYSRVVLESPLVNLTIMAGLFALFLILGTTVFVRSERNR